jgi:hypothetical protein
MERLTARVEELQSAKRLLELKIMGLESEVGELKAQLAAAPAPADAAPGHTALVEIARQAGRDDLADLLDAGEISRLDVSKAMTAPALKEAEPAPPSAPVDDADGIPGFLDRRAAR